MVTYKSLSIIDGKPRWIIEDENGNINKNPTREQLKTAILEDSFSTRRRKLKRELTICCICKKIITDKNYSGVPFRVSHKCDKKDCTGYICAACNSSISNKRSDSHHNIKKYVANCRTGNLYINSPSGKGLTGEVVIAKVRGLRNRNIDEDNMHAKIDLSSDNIYGDIQAKLCTPWRGGWFPFFGREHNFDTLLVLCANRDMKNIEAAYAILEKMLIGKDKIYISKNSIVWKKFRVDERPYNDAFHGLLSTLGNRKYFGIGEVRKWLYGVQYGRSF